MLGFVHCDAWEGAPTPVDPVVAAPDRGMFDTLVRLALAVGIAYQVVQRFTITGFGLSEYGRSLWYVTYQHGFVRRGLAGEALRTIVGGRPTIATVDLVQNVVAVTTLAAMVGLVAVLCHRRTVIAYAAAAALVVAPFAFDSIGGQRRPDLLAFLLLAVIGLWAGTRPVAPTRLALVAGALLALCTLTSEAAPLIVAPWLVLVVLATTRARGGPASAPRTLGVPLCGTDGDRPGRTGPARRARSRPGERARARRAGDHRGSRIDLRVPG